MSARRISDRAFDLADKVATPGTARHGRTAEAAQDLIDRFPECSDGVIVRELLEVPA